jgi:hypothetical protein
MARYGLVIKEPKKKKPKFKYVQAASASKARSKYYGSSGHQKSEGTIISAKKLKKGQYLKFK